MTCYYTKGTCHRYETEALDEEALHTNKSNVGKQCIFGRILCEPGSEVSNQVTFTYNNLEKDKL